MLACKSNRRKPIDSKPPMGGSQMSFLYFRKRCFSTVVWIHLHSKKDCFCCSWLVILPSACQIVIHQRSAVAENEKIPLNSSTSAQEDEGFFFPHDLTVSFGSTHSRSHTDFPPNCRDFLWHCWELMSRGDDPSRRYYLAPSIDLARPLVIGCCW